MKKTNSIIRIVLFTLAGLLTLYSVWAYVNCHNYIAEAISSGQLVASGSEYDIVNFYMLNCVQYTIYAIILFGIGWLLRSRSVLSYKVTSSDYTNNSMVENKEEDLDEWFLEMKQGKEN